jgi:hypothetical protein
LALNLTDWIWMICRMRVIVVFIEQAWVANSGSSVGAQGTAGGCSPRIATKGTAARRGASGGPETRGGEFLSAARLELAAGSPGRMGIGSGGSCYDWCSCWGVRSCRPGAGTPQVDGLPVLVVSGVAALVMGAGALVLGGDKDDGQDEFAERDPSVAAVLLDTIADAAAAAGVAATGGIILAIGGWYWLDPAVPLAIAVVVAYHAIRLISKVLSQIRSATADSSS